jgi:uncharacterized membrane protein HdeD (DUF308 family)
MRQEARRDVADLLAGVGRHWGWMLAFGIITVAIGILALVWPGRTLEVVAILFGLQLVVAGIFQFIRAFSAEEATGGTRVLLALLGVLSFIVGLYALRHVLVTIQALALLLGIFWIVSGAVELFTAISGREAQNRGWRIFMGALGILAGVVVLVYPAISLLTLAVVLGIWLLVYGVMAIVLAFQIRSAGQAAGRIAAAS